MFFFDSFDWLLKWVWFQADFNTAKELLASRQSGNEKPQARAEALRKRATQLLHKTQRYRSDISRK